jgi:hypothetical protein
MFVEIIHDKPIEDKTRCEKAKTTRLSEKVRAKPESLAVSMTDTRQVNFFEILSQLSHEYVAESGQRRHQ